MVYLIFNQGYGDGRVDLADEAIRRGRVLVDLMPDEPEATALLALMLLHDARRDARVRDGEIVLLHDQDRTMWNAEQIAAGRALRDRAIALSGRVRTRSRRRSPRCRSRRRSTGRPSSRSTVGSAS